MTRDERHERGGMLCQRLTDAVVQEYGSSMMRWAWNQSDAQRIIDEPDIALTLALAAWEASETPATYRAVEGAYHSLLNAWRQAGRLYRERELAR